jgi:hypothetical protein
MLCKVTACALDRDGYADDMKKPTAVRCNEIGEDGER